MIILLAALFLIAAFASILFCLYGFVSWKPCQRTALARMYVYPLLIFEGSLLLGVLAPASRSDPWIYPRTLFPLVVLCGIGSAALLAGPLVGGIACLMRDRADPGGRQWLKLAAIAAISLLAAVSLRLVQTGAL